MIPMEPNPTGGSNQMPKDSKTSRCVDAVMKKGKGTDKVTAIKICQSVLGTSYQTGEKAKGTTAKKGK
jgi:hypothetical protein